MMEWKPVRGYEPHYEVSHSGELRKVSGQPVGQWPNDQGYMLAKLSGPRREVRVHRLVAEAFVPNPLGLPAVNHLDCNPANNNADNLEWCTQEANLAYMTSLGRRAKPWLGRRSPAASLSDGQVKSLRAARAQEGLSYAILGQRFGVSKRAAMRCVSKETYADVE